MTLSSPPPLILRPPADSYSFEKKNNRKLSINFNSLSQWFPNFFFWSRGDTVLSSNPFSGTLTNPFFYCINLTYYLLGVGVTFLASQTVLSTSPRMSRNSGSFSSLPFPTGSTFVILRGINGQSAPPQVGNHWFQWEKMRQLDVLLPPIKSMRTSNGVTRTKVFCYKCYKDKGCKFCYKCYNLENIFFFGTLNTWVSSVLRTAFVGVESIWLIAKNY